MTENPLAWAGWALAAGSALLNAVQVWRKDHRAEINQAFLDAVQIRRELREDLVRCEERSQRLEKRLDALEAERDELRAEVGELRAWRERCEAGGCFMLRGVADG